MIPYQDPVLSSRLMQNAFVCHCGEPSVAGGACREAKQSRLSRNQRDTRLLRRRWLLAMTSSDVFIMLLISSLGYSGLRPAWPERVKPSRI